jgi:hypothetical protein
MDQQGCFMSPNWDGESNATYGNDQECKITVVPHGQWSMAGAVFPGIEVVDWAVEECCDKLTVNGAQFTPSNDLNNVVVPVPSNDPNIYPMVWSSDGSVVNAGWRICPKHSDEPVPPTSPPTMPPTAPPSGGVTAEEVEHAMTALANDDHATQAIADAINGH